MLEFQELAFSQEGEDILLDRFLNGQPTGFYVDVGCHHPLRFSNTQRFYMRGWRGINIDPNQEAMSLFDEARSEDINIWSAVGTEKTVADYYVMSHSALNTFDRDKMIYLHEKTPFKHIETLKIPVRTLASILKEHISDIDTIDFMSVDAEGWDINILKSNDWDLFRPRLLLVEDHDTARHPEFQSEMRDYIESIGFTLRCVLFNSILYEGKTA